VESKGWISEKSFCHKELGYGGKVDLYSNEWVIDFKTKDSIEDKKQLAYDAMAHQLVGYERGLPRYHSDTHWSALLDGLLMCSLVLTILGMLCFMNGHRINKSCTGMFSHQL